MNAKEASEIYFSQLKMKNNLETIGVYMKAPKEARRIIEKEIPKYAKNKPGFKAATLITPYDEMFYKQVARVLAFYEFQVIFVENFDNFCLKIDMLVSWASPWLGGCIRYMGDGVEKIMSDL